MVKDKTIGVFLGGKSPEHDISIVTGLLVLDSLQNLGLNYEPVYVATDGAWCLGESLKNKEFLRNIHSQDTYDLQRWSLDTRHRRPRLILTRRPSFFSHREQKVIDIAFPAFHGAYGEDGSVQGLFEFLGVPYVGSGVEGSSIAMNKVMAKQLFQSLGIETTEFVGFSAREWRSSPDAIMNTINSQLKYPLFVKPPHAGSSIGISRVKTPDGVRSAVETVFELDSHCIVENAVFPVRDLTCCVRERGDGSLQPSFIQESHFNRSDFFTYEEKYLNSGGAQLGSTDEGQLTIPAKIPTSDTEAIQKISLRVFREFGLSGIARVDFLYGPGTGRLYANEINPMPGTLYHHLWRETGVGIDELIGDLLDSALRKHAETIKKNRYFSSTLLSSVQGAKFTR